MEITVINQTGNNAEVAIVTEDPNGKPMSQTRHAKRKDGEWTMINLDETVANKRRTADNAVRRIERKLESNKATIIGLMKEKGQETTTKQEAEEIAEMIDRIKAEDVQLNLDLPKAEEKLEYVLKNYPVYVTVEI